MTVLLSWLLTPVAEDISSYVPYPWFCKKKNRTQLPCPLPFRAWPSVSALTASGGHGLARAPASRLQSKCLGKMNDRTPCDLARPDMQVVSQGKSRGQRVRVHNSLLETSDKVYGTFLTKRLCSQQVLFRNPSLLSMVKICTIPLSYK